MSLSAELEDHIAPVVEDRVREAVAMQSWVTVVPDTLEYLELGKNLRQIDGLREMFEKLLAKIREHAKVFMRG